MPAAEVSTARLDVAGVRMLTVRAVPSAAAAGDLADASRVAFEAAQRAVAEHGLPPESVARSRICVADAAHREVVSAVRHDLMAGPYRAASSSRSDTEACAGSPLVVELEAVLDASEKRVVEHRPARAGCRWVEIGPLVFVSGLTARPGSVREQVAELRGSLDAVLSEAGLEAPSVCRTELFEVRTIDAATLTAAWYVSCGDLPGVVARRLVDGLSHPGKWVEAEFTVRRHETART